MKVIIRTGWNRREESELTTAISNELTRTDRYGSVEQISERCSKMADVLSEVLAKLVEKRVLTIDDLNSMLVTSFEEVDEP